MNKMNPEVKAQWLEALRSDDYTQARCALRRDDEIGTSMCCLGVLCDIVDPNAWELSPGNHDGATSSPSARISSAAGLDYYDGINPNNPQHFLMRMNDSQGASFLEIANWIEANL